MKIVVFVNVVKQCNGADFPSTCSDALKITYSITHVYEMYRGGISTTCTYFYNCTESLLLFMTLMVDVSGMSYLL